MDIFKFLESLRITFYVLSIGMFMNLLTNIDLVAYVGGYFAYVITRVILSKNCVFRVFNKKYTTR